VKSGSNTWSGANDFSGATSFVVRFGTTAPASGDCDTAGERGNVYVRTGDPATIATRVSVCTQTGASTYAWNPISHKVGTTAPATCVIGEIFFDSDATAGSNWLGCTATDTWTTQGSGSGGAPTGAQYLTLATDATLTAERVLTPDANMSVTDGGAGGAYTFGPDTAKILSRATHQAGALRVASSTGSDTYTGTATPTLTTYTDGMVVEFEATAAANTGAASLNIDTLGAVNIKLCDGSTDPATGDIAVGKQVPLRYDGTVFRLPCNPATLTGVTAPLTYRTCSIVFGSDNGSALADADLGPQGRICLVPVAGTVVEVTVAADAGTPSIVVRRNRAGTGANFLTALATAASGGLACSKTSAVTGLDGATTCSATLTNTGLNAGDWIEAISGTAGGTAKRMSVAITYTVN